jgi:4-amino-4-deoxy-L-arabinose transferase-like glycosyltransferase
MPPLGDVMVQWRCPSSYPLDNWYYWAVPEDQMFGKFFLYGGTNDGNAILLAARVMQIILTLLTGVVIFFWARRATNHDEAALIALAIWAFNPTALAYGHVCNTDMGATFGIALAVYMFARWLERPTLKSAALAGAATGVAMSLKFSSLILGPTFIVALVLFRKRLKRSVPDLCKMAGLFALAGWCVTLIAFFPNWTPAPPLTERDVALFDVPSWFRILRPVLIPPGLFKGIAVALGHVRGGTNSYLMGQWSQGGWWYYFPLSFLLKSPVCYVVLVLGSLGLFLRRMKSIPMLEQIAWLGAGVYILSAMTSGINIGARHLMPMMPLFSVGIGCAISKLADRRLKLLAVALVIVQAISVVLAYPLYIQFFSEAVGGARNGYKYLIDSNFDWGQDAKRLKRFLDERQIRHVYLDYFGNQFSIEYLKISNTRVDAEQAKQIREGVLVVSASQLMRAEWAWLRESRQPVERVAHTLFVYQFP